MSNRSVAVFRRSIPGFVPMSRMRGNLLDTSDPPVVADACELGLGPGAVHRDDIVHFAADVRIVHPGSYCFAVGSPGAADGEGTSSFIKEHYNSTTVTGVAGDVIPLSLEFPVDSSLGLAWGVYANLESIPIQRRGAVSRHKWAALTIAVAAFAALFLRVAAALW